MIDPISMICSLTGCSEDQAKEAYEQTEDTLDAIDLLLEKPVSKSEKYIPKLVKKPLTAEQIEIQKVREVMKQMDDSRSSTSSDQPCYEEQDEQPSPHEEMVLQNNCSQQCQLPSLEEAVQIQETAYRLQSEYFCGSQ